MAYMNQEKKKLIAQDLKEALKGVNIKYSLGVRHHSTIVMNIWESDIDFFGEIKGEATIIKDEYLFNNLIYNHQLEG